MSPIATQKSLYSPWASHFLICDLVPPSVLSPDARLILLSSFFLLIEKIWIHYKLSSDVWFSYGQKWITLLNETRNENTTFHMETCQSSGCSCVQRDQVLKLSVDFLRGIWCLVLLSQSIHWSKALHTVRKNDPASVMSPVAAWAQEASPTWKCTGNRRKLQRWRV